jgi:predicted NBD/HSP70 family sugar kinase
MPWPFAPRPTPLRIARDATTQVEPTSSDAARETAATSPQSLELATFMALARRRMRAAMEGSQTWRAKADEDRRFRSGEDQWDKAIKADRDAHQRPCLVVNRIAGYHKQVTNSLRSTRPGIRVKGVDAASDKKTAEVFQDYIRHIENISDADLVYNTGADSQVDVGVGWWRILTEWADEKSFEQEIRLAAILNYASVYVDPGATSQDASDANFVFVVQDLSKDEYRIKYPTSSLSSLDDLSGVGDTFHGDWLPGGKIRLADYYYVEPGDGITIAEILDPNDPFLEDTICVPMGDVPEGVTVFSTRQARERVVRWAQINGDEILDGDEPPTTAEDGWKPTKGQRWPGRYLPVIRVVGEQVVVNGEIDYRGIVRDGKDPARMNNYLKTAEIEAIALVPQASWVGGEGAFEGHPEWDLPPNVSVSKREYKPTTFEGHLVPSPHREVSEPAIDGLILADSRFEQDLRAVIGWVDAQAQERKPEQSGKAILARQAQGETQTAHFLDNWSRSIRATGRALVDLIPKVITRRQIIRLRGADDQERTVMVHAGTPLPAAALADPEQRAALEARLKARGLKSLDDVYDLSAGKFDVVTSAGPTYQARRQEAVETMIEMGRAFPPIAPMIADLIAKYGDWPQEIVDRLHKALPPNLQQDEGDAPPVPPALMAKLQEQAAIIQDLTQRLQALGEEQRTKAVQIASEERIAMEKIRADALKTLATIDAQNARALLTAEYDRIGQSLQQIEARVQAETAAAAPSLGSSAPSPAAPDQSPLLPPPEALASPGQQAEPTPMPLVS